MEEDIRKGLRMLSGERSHIIWQIAKKGELSGLSPEDRKLAETMLEHEEYHNQFEMADILGGHEYDPDREVNPFLHIAIHAVAETQLENRDPLEVYQLYNAMRKKKASHHDAVHLIGAILTPLLFRILRDEKPFALEEYQSRLKKFKTMKPEKIYAFLEKEEDSPED